MTNDELEFRLKEEREQFAQAVVRLSEALATPLDEHNLVRDSAIKRFELCADLAWKTMKIYMLAKHDIECASPRTCVREAFAQGLIEENDSYWIEIYKIRNETVRTYKEALAKEVHAKLPDALKRFEKLLVRLS